MNKKVTSYWLSAIICFVFSSAVFGQQNLGQEQNLFKYTIDPNPEQTKVLAQEQYKICPPLRPDRFIRRVKMLWGIDINDYPEDSKLRFGYQFTISKKFQIIEYLDTNDEDLPYLITDHQDKMYYLLRYYIIYQDMHSLNELFQFLLDRYQRLMQIEINKEFPLEVDYESNLLKQYYNSAIFDTDLHLIDYVSKKGSKYYNSLFNSNFSQELSRLSDRKIDQIVLNLDEIDKNQIDTKNNKSRNWVSDYFSSTNSPLMLLSSIIGYNKFSYKNTWSTYSSARGASSCLNLFLQLKNKETNKIVIQFMSDQLFKNSSMSHFSNNIGLQDTIKSNNYYGYTILREFCENPMRETPTLEKIGTNFKATVKRGNTLLLLEPFSDSYDIDTIQTNETFKAYEMGHDDYYFVEIEKPVESPVAGADGYAMILDRKETVYGYVLKSQVKEYTSQDVLREQKYINKSESKRGVIHDKDGYVNIRKEANAQSEILGKIQDKEVFDYWETPDNWYIIETKDGIRGYIYKDRIKEKLETGGWILDE